MTTAAELVEETKRHLNSFQREPMNKLSAPLTSSATSVTFTYPVDQLQAGSLVEVGLELMYVWSIDPATRSAVVQRAHLGSVATAHDTSDLVRVNPRFPDFHIFKALNDDLAELSSPSNGLYAVRDVDITTSGSRIGYDLAGASGLIDIIEVRYKQRGGFKDWPILPSWSLGRGVDATDFPSGYALTTHSPLESGRSLNVLYKAGFTPLLTLASDVTAVTGLPASMHDLPPLGAAMRLLAPREAKRNFTEAQGDSRRAQEVPAGAVAASLRPIALMRQNRINAEATKLVAAYPTRFPMTYGAM